MKKFYGNTAYEGDTRIGPLWSVSKDVHQTWTTYTYYRLEADLDSIDLDITPAFRDNFMVARSWSKEYFEFLYNTVGKDYSWWYMNYKSGEEIDEYLNSDAREYITLMQDGQPAGFAVLTYERETCNLSYFGMMPYFVGKGIGRLFLHDCLLQASYSSKNAWVYTTSKDHPAALPLYKSIGFSVVEEKQMNEYYPTEVLES